MMNILLNIKNPPKKPQQSNGFTLMELLVVITIIAVLASLAIPTFTHLLKKYESFSATSAIHDMVGEAKVLAFSQYRNVVLCPTNDFINCNKINATHIMSFHDINNNKKKDKDESIQTVLNVKLRYGKISFNLSRRSRYMRFYPDTGMPRGHYGNITYCPKNSEDIGYAKSVIVNKMGSARFSKDTNGDGIDEGRRGNLQCV